MKKCFLAMLFVLSTFWSNAQAQDSNCNFNYQISISPTKSNLLESLQDAQMNWDFSKLKLNKDLSVTIEVVSIFDCFNGEKATDLKDAMVINSNDSGFKSKGTFTFKLEDIIAKCFKWRVIVKSKNCTEISNWNQFSFLK
ncbi:hypothetical protein [Flavobacterium sp.]|uniref:hypothetical protein n=1 Tax=Flavobacterium sp. TaxID=239 RepID=UPI00404777B2